MSITWGGVKMELWSAEELAGVSKKNQELLRKAAVKELRDSPSIKRILRAKTRRLKNALTMTPDSEPLVKKAPLRVIEK